MISSNINITKPTYMENEFSLFKKEKKQSSADNELSESDKKRVQELKKIDREVRTHEQAHLAASGGLARGGASFTYTKGPDGKKYASGGEVSIEISPVEGKPEETIRRMQQVRRAATAPADPSSQDRSVAAKATREEAKARAELSKPQDDEKEKNNSGILSVYKNEFQESTFSVTA
ncbi:MAG: hypothetical protein CVV25_05605 [Ignavibacteriae bacterium HGW-Ignavibacteriae-4]|jgi:rare lipoprotein A (peptidoglycan hydrolase)|nr:MAG: hypothetical protein CVV25_05605 [Ignavibacteriae bacterium HGW-Ignavibacteriae-4]